MVIDDETKNKIVSSYDNNSSLRGLSRRFKISRSKIRNVLVKDSVKIRDSRASLVFIGRIKEKNKFNLDEKEKAYLFGLVLGDLTPVKRSSYNLRLITNTTHMSFVKLLKNSFSKYGPVNYWLNKGKNDFQFHASLDFESFSFLMDKKKEVIPPWIGRDNFMEFLAGFIDSDGSVILKKAGSYFQFVIRFFGQNLPLLNQIKRKLEILGYSLSMHKNHSQGDVSYHQGIKFEYNKDYYALEITQKEQTTDLLRKLPIRHPEKIAKRKLIFQIYDQNVVHWSLIENQVKSLKLAIKQLVLSKKYLKWKPEKHCLLNFRLA